MLKLLFGLGIIFAVVAAPLIFAIWFWGERKLDPRQWAMLTGMLLAGFALMRVFPLAIFAGLVELSIGLAWLWHKLVLTDVRYERAVHPTHLFPGEQATVEWSIRNDKPLPVSWLRWNELLPGSRFGSKEADGLSFVDAADKNAGTLDLDLTQIAALRSFGDLTFTASVRAQKRGYYRFSPAHFEASDILGLYSAEREFEVPCTITVYPQIKESNALELDIHALLGEWRRRDSLVEDPTWYRGDREYQTSDAMRSIAWKTSARTGQLQVKTFDPTVHPKLMLLVNLHAFERVSSGWVTEYMEDVIATGASIAKWGLNAGYEVGIHSNGALPGAHAPFRILPSAGEDQLFSILEYLARISLVISRPIEDTLGDLTDLPHGTAVMICTNVVTQGLISALHEGARRRRTALVLVDNNTPLSIPGVRILQDPIVRAA